MAANKNPGPVPAELRDFFRGKAPAPSWDYTEVWGEEHKQAFTVAKVLEQDLLDTFREAVVRAQVEGVPFEQWKKDLTPVLEARGWFGQAGVQDKGDGKAKSRRLEIVYQTNLRMARAHGQWERIQRRKRAQPMLRYRLGPSEKHRPEHVLLDGLIYPVGHPFWQTHFPPNGYGCNCWVEQLTQAGADALGGPSAEFDTRLFPDKTYRDPRNGAKRTVPFAVQPGFEFPPGLGGRTAGVRKALAERR